MCVNILKVVDHQNVKHLFCDYLVMHVLVKIEGMDVHDATYSRMFFFLMNSV